MRIFSSFVAIALTVTAARAATACPVQTVAEGRIPAAWRDATEELAADLASVNGPRCPVVVVKIAADATTSIHVTLPDGRGAARIVRTPNELSSVAFGLLESLPPDPAPPRARPPEPAPEAEAEPEPLSPSEPPPIVRAILPAEPPLQRLPLLPPPSRITSSMGLAFGTRIAMPYGVVASDVELGTDVLVDRWVFDAHMGGSPLGTRLTNDDIHYREWGFGGGAGRWFPVGRGRIAWTAGPGFEQTSFVHGRIRRHRDDVLMQTAARFVTPFGTRWHPTIAFEIDAMPALALAETERTPAAREGFPALSAGLRFGLVGDPL